MLPEQLLFKEKIDNFEVEFSSIEFSREKNHDKTTEIDRIIDSLSDKVSVLDAEIDKLTNHADTFDYIVAVASGIITGLVDSFWVGEIDWAKAKADAHKTINKFIERKARNEGISQGISQGINQGKKIERKEKNIEYVRKLMERLQMSFKEAVSLLEIPEKEIKEIEKYFQS